MNNYYTGTSGLLLPVPNKQFYPEEFKEKSRLCYYASLVNSIEINSSFYKIPQATTLRKWAGDVPENFRFTFKLFKEITHTPDLRFDASLLNKFMETIAAVGGKKGCLLVQFPPSIRINHLPQISNLAAMLRDNDPLKEWSIAMEFRHSSLYVSQLRELLAAFDIASVIHDKGTASSPMDMSDADFVYLRFHGPDGNYKGSYSADILAEYASYIVDWMIEGKKVYAYFNNTMGNAHGNLNTLCGFVKTGLSNED
ncbi:DUF72 domain-containing protein [Pedobacter frigidisoli]|uniref:DUF72 domain-containing protein n=1 Tax=Pedobacter frigidisoli TaxID=2530455 RepID=A0A4V6N695_9SPHI|nr:DUF72 domain-containing protein [Pedobacter frigidisoli]